MASVSNRANMAASTLPYIVEGNLRKMSNTMTCCIGWIGGMKNMAGRMRACSTPTMHDQ